MTTMNLRLQRKKMQRNQTEFWGAIGVTQSTGSRYELGMEMPATVYTLIDLCLGKWPLTQLAYIRGTTVAQLIAEGK